MAYDSVRAQLDKLLGPDRNGPLTTNTNREPLDYRDSSICKHYLLGFCPNDLHIKHRSEPGSCRRTHSDAAKAAFEKDVAAGRAREERVRWLRVLLGECRSIVADEDRKIRGHARRLQETYSSSGDLSSLMIRSFDTLKKLGMVSQNAKIKILSEMDDDEFRLPASDDEGEQDGDFGTKKDVRSPKTRSESSRAPTTREHIASEKDEDDDSEKGGNSYDDDDDDDDDDDGFGVIKVISASGDGATPSEKRDEADVEEGKLEGRDMPSTCVKDAGSAPSSEGKHKLPEACHDGPDSASVAKSVSAMEDGDGEPEGIISAAKDARTEGKTGEASSDLRPSESDVTDATNNPPDGEDRKPASVAELKSTSERAEKSENVMDKFYAEGVGPDGLLMLDRKQSLRVCACCGGYISLVDAESRLLSHYGGKSHHSLAQLRNKVVELEKVLASEGRVRNEPNPRGYSRNRVDERESNWSRRDEPRYRPRDRPGRFGDRRGGWHGEGYGDRVSSYRGHGTTDWYSSSGRDRDGRSGPRRSDERARHDYRSDGRYESGRKRYRSPSPYRSSRRSRR